MNHPARPGTFIVSLDFELYWGMIDKVTLDAYGENVLGVRKALPGMLALFREHGIRATWATLGLISFGTKDALLAGLPARRPQYRDMRLSPYAYLEQATIGDSEEDDKYHFAASLIELLKQHPEQEVGSHTFSHYYCLEEGQTADDFRADLVASKDALAAFGIVPESLVLPRNQSREEYLPIVRELGFMSYRGNPRHWLYRARAEGGQTNPFIRALRLIDHYLPLSGCHIYGVEALRDSMPYNVPASSFLRPYSRTLRFFEPLKRARIKASMTKAAKTGKIFHLWWHPHNFGRDIEQNLRGLADLLAHYDSLKERYGMENRTMRDMAQILAHE